jgi:DNA-binding transcriptional LysR family regulator
VAKHHPLAASSQQATLEDLTRFNAILTGETTFTRQIVEHHFHQQALNLKVVMSTNYLDTIRMMVSIGLGWSLLPETLIDDNLSILNITTEELHRPLGYIYHRKRTLSNAAQAFIQLLRTQVDTDN